jgi:hypothetical protein
MLSRIRYNLCKIHKNGSKVMTDKTDSRNETHGPNTKWVTSKEMAGSTAAKKLERKRKPAGQEGAITDHHEPHGLESTAFS